MPLYVNVKTFALAAVKPLIQALKTRFDYQVKYINKRVNAQDDSFMQLQKDFAELNKKVVEGTDAYLEYRKQLQGFEAKLYTADQVKALDRRVQQLLIVINELYILISNKLPNEELPDLDPWLPDDPIPLASDFEAEWRKELQVDPDVELTEEVSNIRRDVIANDCTNSICYSEDSRNKTGDSVYNTYGNRDTDTVYTPENSVADDRYGY